MRFQYTYRTSAFDLWQLSMYHIYGSIVGVCNAIFTAAMLALIVTQWGHVNGLLRILMALGLCLFPAIQPLLVYGKARRQAAGIVEDVWIGFDEAGIHVKVGGQSSSTRWREIRRVSQKPTLLIVYSDTTHGYLLMNRVLGEEREALYRFITSRMRG